jgi:hypothetical protein
MDGIYHHKLSSDGIIEARRASREILRRVVIFFGHSQNVF